MGFLVENNPVKQIERLQVDFLAYSYLYYIKNKSIVPDYYYDNICNSLYKDIKNDYAKKSRYYEECKDLDSSGSGFYIKEKDYPEHIKKVVYKLERQKEEGREIPMSEIEKELENKRDSDNKVVIYTDGSSSNAKTRCGGWGFLLMYKGMYKEGYGGEEPDQTNQTMEIYAVTQALKQIKTKNIPIEIYSDSAYVCNCFIDKWYEGWIERGWKNSNGKRVKNIKFWKELIPLVQRQKDIEFIHIRGHQGEEFNERVDDLAVKGRYEIEERLGFR